MRTHRVGALFLIALTTAAVALAGCGKSPAAPSGMAATPSSSPSMAPKDVLLASVKVLHSSPYHFTSTTGGLTSTGDADPTKPAISMNARGTVQGATIDMTLIAIDNAMFAKLDFGALNKALGVPANQWLHLDQAKMGNTKSIPFDLKSVDMLGFDSIMNATFGVQRVDATHFTGSIDLTAISGSSNYSSDDLKKLGDKAKAMPFTATIDGKGQIGTFAIDTSSVEKDLSVTFSLTGIGTAMAITKPAGATEAPASVYKIFQG